AALTGEEGGEEVVHDWTVGQEVRPGKYTLTDFDFEKPALDLTASTDGKDARKYEIYDYPGEYKTRDDGERLTGVRMQEQEVSYTVVDGSSNCPALAPGYKIDLENHYRRDLNKSYVPVAVSHAADAGSNY